jgi:hypothetical protein
LPSERGFPELSGPAKEGLDTGSLFERFTESKKGPIPLNIFVSLSAFIELPPFREVDF